jgi:sugar transferase (PEP-CTERM/EpsH1 system associated)
MNILFVVPYVPDLVRVRPYNLIRHLIECGHRVTLATLWSNKEEQSALESLKKVCYQVYACELSKWRTLFNCAMTVPTRKPLQASFCWQPELARQLGLLTGKVHDHFDIVHVEHLRGARYGLYLKSLSVRKASSPKDNPPIVWDSVDCISSLFRQAAEKSQSATSRMITRFEANRTYRYEKWLVEQFNRVLVTSILDKNAFQFMRETGDRRPEITVIPNGVDLEYFKRDPLIIRRKATLVISGKMSYHANVAMVLYLTKDILPIVWSQKPEVELWIVGKDPPESIMKLGENPAIKVTGTVDDIRPYLQKATLAVAPITYGAGIQNKVLEAMACETPVVTTPKAVSALSTCPGRDLLVADEPQQFAQAVLELLDDPEKQKALGYAGRQYVELNHNWAVIASKLADVYREVIEKN